MALSHKKQVERARKRWDKASKALCDYAIANGHGYTKLNELHKYVPAELIQADNETHQAWVEAENNAVAALKAYRGTFGILIWYR